MIFESQWFSPVRAHHPSGNLQKWDTTAHPNQYRSAALPDLLRTYREEFVDAIRLETLLFSATCNAPGIVMRLEGLGSIAMWKDFPEQLAEVTARRVLV